jgi:hypothetical protein
MKNYANNTATYYSLEERIYLGIFFQNFPFQLKEKAFKFIFTKQPV